MKSQSRSVSDLLQRVKEGDRTAFGELYGLIYSELTEIASRCIRMQPGHHTISPCGLVHEAYVKLTHAEAAANSRSHFFGVAAQAMRWILVDRARSRLRTKRRATGEQIPLSVLCVSTADAIDVVALHEALDEFAKVDERAAKIVEMHCFSGMEFREIAEALGIGERTAQRQWAAARAYLASVLK